MNEVTLKEPRNNQSLDLEAFNNYKKLFKNYSNLEDSLNSWDGNEDNVEGSSFGYTTALQG